MANNPLFAHSYSRLNDWRNCPYLAYHKYVLKSVPYEESATLAEGKRVHKALELRVQTGNQLPADLQQHEQMCWDILMMPGRALCEVEMALDVNLRPCGWKDWDRAFIRAKADLVLLNEDQTSAWNADYKTGKPSPSETQLRLSSLVLMQQFPTLQEVTASYLWLNYDGKMDTERYERANMAVLWQPLFEDFAAIQEDYVTVDWPATPKAKWVCAYCPVNKAGLCQFKQAEYRGE